MAPVLVVAAIGVAPAGVFGALGRQFKAYGNGQATYLSRLEGNLWLLITYIVILSAVASGLITVLVNGSATVFGLIFLAFALFAGVVSWSLWAYSRKRL